MSDGVSNVFAGQATSSQINDLRVTVIGSAIVLAVVVIVAARWVNSRQKALIDDLTSEATWARVAQQLRSIRSQATEINHSITRLHGEVDDIDDRATWLAILLAVLGSVIALGTGLAIEWAHTNWWKDVVAFVVTIGISVLLAVVVRAWLAPFVRLRLHRRRWATKSLNDIANALRVQYALRLSGDQPAREDAIREIRAVNERVDSTDLHDLAAVKDRLRELRVERAHR